MEGIKFKHLRITRLPGAFTFVWEKSGVAETLSTGISDHKKSIELSLVDPKTLVLTKTLIEFTLWRNRITGTMRRCARNFLLDATGAERRLTNRAIFCASPGVFRFFLTYRIG
jgi:hypothetical protein